MGAPKLAHEHFEYEFFAEFMKLKSGVHLPRNPKNEALVLNRVSKVMRVLKIESFSELKENLSQADPETLREFIANLTTHKTNFFREEAHFSFLTESLKQHFKSKSSLRIWCAAASSGQEPYTIALTLAEALGLQKQPVTKFLATDIDLRVLETASQGFYLENELEGISQLLQKKYFQPKIVGGKKGFVVHDDIRRWIQFAPLNLTQKDYGFKGQFDYIFCRNVLIYFDPETTAKVIDQMTQCLNVGGYLILGHSESGVVKHPNLKSESRAIFRKVK